MTKNNYWVSLANNGWKAKREGSNRAVGIFDTQKKAEDCVRRILRNGVGGELITKGRDGEIRSKDTINSNDPIPPRDREN